MNEISLKLWRNHGDQNWSAEINGVRYESVSIDEIEGVIQRALVFAEMSESQLPGRNLIH